MSIVKALISVYCGTASINILCVNLLVLLELKCNVLKSMLSLVLNQTVLAQFSVAFCGNVPTYATLLSWSYDVLKAHL